MKTMRLSWLFIAGVVPMLACGGGGGAKAQGGVGQACYPNGTCNAGLSCFSKLCVDVNVDGAAGAMGSAGTTGIAGAGTAGSAGASGGADAAAGASGSAGADGAVDAPATETGGGTEAGIAEAGADASTFNVATLPGLVMWLDAAKGVTVTNANVSAWQDQSTNGNDATTPSGPPAVLVTNAIAGLPAIELGPTAQLDTQPANSSGVATLGFGTGDVLVEEVAKWSVASPSTILFATYTGSGMNQREFLTLIGDSNGHAVGGEDDGAIVGLEGGAFVSSSSTALGNGSFHLVGVRRTGTSANATLEVRVNGAIEATSTGSMYGSDLGALGGAVMGFGMPLDIAEVVVVKGTTSADDLSHLETYLKTKYGL